MTTLTLLSLLQYLVLTPLPFEAPERGALFHYARTGDPSGCEAAWKQIDDSAEMRRRIVLGGPRQKRTQQHFLDLAARQGDAPLANYHSRKIRHLEKMAPNGLRRFLGEWLRREVFRLSRRGIELGRLLLWRGRTP